MAPTDDDNRSSGAQEGPKRPTPTIELEAEVVDAPDDKDADGPAPEHGDQTPPENGDEEAGQEAVADREAAASPEQAAGPGRSWLAVLAGNLAAGLVGGLIGVIGAVIGLDRLPGGTIIPGTPGSGGTPAIEKQLGQMRGEIDALQSALKTRGDQAPLTQSIADLEGRLTKAEAALGGQSGDNELGARVGRLETVLANIGTGEGEGGPMVGVVAQINELANRFDSRITALQGDLKTSPADTDAIKADITALKSQNGELVRDLTKLSEAIEGGTAGQGTAALGLEKMEPRVAVLEEQIGALAERNRVLEVDAKMAVLAIALANLKRATENGAAYAQELDTVKSLIPTGSDLGRLDLASLEAGALTGVRSTKDLTNAFPTYSAAALDATAVPKSDALVDKIAARARSLVRVRPSGPGEGSGTGAVLARMEGHLKAGELAKAVEEAGALQGAGAKVMAPWTAGAKARLSLDRGMDGLERGLLGAVGRARTVGAG